MLTVVEFIEHFPKLKELAPIFENTEWVDFLKLEYKNLIIMPMMKSEAAVPLLVVINQIKEGKYKDLINNTTGVDELLRSTARSGNSTQSQKSPRINSIRELVLVLKKKQKSSLETRPSYTASPEQIVLQVPYFKEQAYKFKGSLYRT